MTAINTSIKNILILTATTLLFLTSSCGTRETSKPSGSDQKSSINTNVVKVLNRVKCDENQNAACTQNDFNAIWQVCIDNGYVTQIPSSRIISSRELKELVSGTIGITENEYTTTESTDANGIVYETAVKPKSVTIQKSIKGYCLGSEYITQ